MDSDLKELFTINDRTIAEEVQNYLDGFKIYTMITSDNPSSSAINAFMGANPIEGITVLVNVLDYPKAVKILGDSQYKSLVNNA